MNFAEKAANLRAAAGILITSFAWAESSEGVAFWVAAHEALIAKAVEFEQDAEHVRILDMLVALDG